MLITRTIHKIICVQSMISRCCGAWMCHKVSTSLPVLHRPADKPSRKIQTGHLSMVEIISLHRPVRLLPVRRRDSSRFSLQCLPLPPLRYGLFCLLLSGRRRRTHLAPNSPLSSISKTSPLPSGMTLMTITSVSFDTSSAFKY